MSRKFTADDPRYHDRFEAAVELLKLWRNIVQDGPGIPRYVILPGEALNGLVNWTDSFLGHPEVQLKRRSQKRELS